MLLALKMFRMDTSHAFFQRFEKRPKWNIILLLVMLSDGNYHGPMKPSLQEGKKYQGPPKLMSLYDKTKRVQ